VWCGVCVCVWVWCVCVCLCVVCVGVCRYGRSVGQGQLIGTGMDEIYNIAYNSVYIIITTALILLNQHAPIGSKECVIEHR